MLATLAEVDAQPGRGWQRELLRLVAAGLHLRARGLWAALTPRRLAVSAAIGALLTAMAPASVWAERVRSGGSGDYPILDGPTPDLRRLLLAAAALSLSAALTRRDARGAIRIAACTGAVAVLQDLASNLHRAGAYPLTGADLVRMIPGVVLLTAAVAVCGLALSRVPMLVAVRAASGMLAIVCVTAVTAAARADPPSSLAALAVWQLEPAGLLSILTITLAGLALVASQRRADTPASSP